MEMFIIRWDTEKSDISLLPYLDKWPAEYSLHNDSVDTYTAVCTCELLILRYKVDRQYLSRDRKIRDGWAPRRTGGVDAFMSN